ncbi:MAG: DUF4304 domain-containing protein [Pirellulales bacterium]
MAEPRAYEWDYERSPLTQESGFITLSIGVFQWLPKANGKGLKKSKSIRVAGYMSEPERVYDKAQELCDHFNKAGVRAESPPPWVQKQYSVPQPFDMVVERTDELTSGQVRAARIQVMKRVPAPRGFVRGDDGAYARRRDGQIHLIQFQASKYGHEYTVNLGFHYDFLPPFYHKTTIPLVEYDLLDCAISERIGYFTPEKRDLWFPYGNNHEVLKQMLEENVRVCLAAFDEVTHRWADPGRWLSNASLQSLRPWTVSATDIRLFRCLIAAHLGKFRDAEESLSELVATAPSTHYREWYESLLLTVRERAGS